MKNFAAVEPDSDVLNGLAEIAAYIRRNKRRTHYLVKTGRIPVTRLGPKTIVGSKSKISAVLKSS
jgi:hypothetical protein